MPNNPDLFDETRFPALRRVCHSKRYGRMELLSVDKTSDGFLLGHAKIGEGDEAYYHSIFLGAAVDFQGEG